MLLFCPFCSNFILKFSIFLSLIPLSSFFCCIFLLSPFHTTPSSPTKRRIALDRRVYPIPGGKKGIIQYVCMYTRCTAPITGGEERNGWKKGRKGCFRMGIHAREEDTTLQELGNGYRCEDDISGLGWGGSGGWSLK